MTSRIDNPDTPADVELRECLSQSDPPSFLMVAGAGSGKTTSLIKALHYLSETRGAELRRRQQQIACITYTEIAVGEILGDVRNDPLFHVSTIHSFLWSLIRPFQRDIKAWVIQHIQERLKELRGKTYGPRVQQKTKDRDAREVTHLEEVSEKVAAIRRFVYMSGKDYTEGILGHDDVIKMGPDLIQCIPLLGRILASKYPFFFIDESQDTFPSVVDALKGVGRQNPKFCLGFFGDAMQQIYVSGAGKIVAEPNWKEITKPENFRCPTTVLDVINRIRAKGDGLQQTCGREVDVDGHRKALLGTARAFVLPADEDRSLTLPRVRQWLSKVCGDQRWVGDDGDGLRILVIVHRMAATRLGFADLFAAFNDGAPASLSDGFREGTAWPLKPFLDALLPLALAAQYGKHGAIMNILRTHCPQLDQARRDDKADVADMLKRLRDDVTKIAGMLSVESVATVGEVLHAVNGTNFIRLEDRVREYLLLDEEFHQAQGEAMEPPLSEGEDEKTAAAIGAYLACPVQQLWGYHKYVSDSSPYSTQQGIKGAEFDRVLVVMDDEESNHFQFSYDKLFGLKAPSKADLDNQGQGKETALDRTRRLFYVCCSRARQDLAVVFFHKDVQAAVDCLKQQAIFEPQEIYTLEQMA